MFENVIVGVDGRPAGRDAIELARHLVSPRGKLTLANVHSGEPSPVHAVTGRAVYGLPGEELAAFSADVNLLVVGSATTARCATS